MKISGVETKHYLLPLHLPMTDASHGVMTQFEVVLAIVQTKSGQTGYGYTYTIGQGGAAIRSLIDRDLRPILIDGGCGSY